MQLHILIKNNGDGSSSNLFILDPDVLAACEAHFECSETHPGVDGDGFHYASINIPDNSTIESLGLSEWDILSKEDMLNDYNIVV